MKHLTITILSILFSISATAQEADTTAAKGDKLNFEQPRFLVSDYFSSVKAHLSKEGVETGIQSSCQRRVSGRIPNPYRRSPHQSEQSVRTGHRMGI